MADAKFSIGQVNITNNLRVIAREVANPTIEVANVIYTAPHPSIRNILITGLNPKTHYFDFYETTASSGSSPIGTLLATFTIDIGLINQSTIEIIEFIVGDTGAPAHGDVNYVNTDLDGIDTSHIEVVQRSIGPRSWNDEISLYAGGGFTLLGGELFNQDDRWFLTVVKDETVAAPSGTANLFDDVKFITANTTINSTHYNNLLIMSAASGWTEVTFPNLSSIPNKTRFTFNTLDGTATGTKIIMGGTGIIQFNGSGETTFYLRRYEVVSFIVYSGVLFLYDGKGNWDRVGDQVIAEKSKSNFTDETTLKEWGQWVDIDDEPRLFYWFVNKLPSDYLATSSATEFHKWYIDLPNNRFRVPNSPGHLLSPASTLSYPGSNGVLPVNTSPPTTYSLSFVSNHINRIL